MVNISDKLYKLRIERDLTQADMGKIAGVSDKTISAWEAGARCPKVVPYIQNICKHFQLDMLTFIDEGTDNFGYKNQPIRNDGLSDAQHTLIQFACSLSDEQATHALQILKLVLGDKQ